MRFPLAERGRLLGAVLGAAWAILLSGPALAQEKKADDKGWETIFDGESLEGWDGNPDFWSVQDGAITGQTTADKPTKGNTFIIWRDGTVGDFELTLDYKIIGGNSGIQYRSFEVPGEKWVIGGYQGDFEAGKTYSGILYGEKFRGILCPRGGKTELVRNGGMFEVKNVGSVGDSDAIQSKIKNEDWNTYRIVAKGFTFKHYINDVQTAECTDNDEKERRTDGLLALQLHAGPPMKVQFKNIKLKRLGEKKTSQAAPLRINIADGDKFVVNGKKLTNAQFVNLLQTQKPKQIVLAADPSLPYDVLVRVMDLCKQNAVNEISLQVAAQAKAKKVVLIAGRASHGFGQHEHKAGCMLLADALNKSGLGIKAEVVTDGWPKDESILDDADSIVIYADGGGGHPFNQHLDKINSLMKKGTGLVCIHYGVEVPKGPSGDAFLDWTGGYFEPDWSVNPHWDADYDELPKHPITRGVKPFKINDEWYYHMRFRDEMEGVTPILTDLPPDSTLSRPDGPHSGNPAVRKAIANKEPQHMAWATEREDGGRGFGFTGGHFHWNWGHDQFRKLMLNAIAWTAKAEVPEDGVPSKLVTVKDLMANQDDKVPDDFNPLGIQAMLDQWNK